MGSIYKLMQGITFVGQLGFMIVTPPLVLVFLAYQLQSRFDFGPWVMVLAIIVGIISAVSSAMSTIYKLFFPKKPETPREKLGGEKMDP